MSCRFGWCECETEISSKCSPMQPDCSQPYSAAQKRSLKLADVPASQLPETAGNVQWAQYLVVVFSFSAINYPINHLDHLSSLQYVTKNNSELHQRAIPKRAPVLTIVDERDDSVERQVQRIPTIEPVVTDSVSQPDDVTSKAQPEISNLKPITEDVAVQNDPVSSTVVSADEAPHVHVEPDEAREARLDKQWKQLKVDVADLPDIYGRLAKIKLTGRVHSTDTRL